MFHIGRSGSTVLCDMLNQHSDVSWDGELLKGTAATTINKPLRYSNPADRWYNSPYFPDRPFSFIESHMSKANTRFFGFETKFFHLSQNNIELGDFSVS